MNCYATTDASIAAFLLARGHEIDLVRVAAGRHEFRFPADAEADALAYLKGASIVAKTFAAAVKDLKSLMYASSTQPTNSARNEVNNAHRAAR